MKKRFGRLMLAAILIGGLNTGLAVSQARANLGCMNQDCSAWCDYGWEWDGWLPRYGLHCVAF